MFGTGRRLNEIEAELRTLSRAVESSTIFQIHYPRIHGDYAVRENPDITVEQAIQAILDYLQLELTSEREKTIPMKVTATKGGK